VINRNLDGDYVKSVDEFELLPGSLAALRRLREAGWQVVVISNQACVGKGIISGDALAEVDRAMKAWVTEAGGEIAASYYCTHRSEDGCDCRKPAPGLIIRASRDLGIRPEEAVLVGDSAADVQAGKAVGCRTVVVLSGRISAQEAQALDPAPDLIAADLAETADWLIAGSQSGTLDSRRLACGPADAAPADGSLRGFRGEDRCR